MYSEEKYPFTKSKKSRTRTSTWRWMIKEGQSTRMAQRNLLLQRLLINKHHSLWLGYSPTYIPASYDIICYNSIFVLNKSLIIWWTDFWRVKANESKEHSSFWYRTLNLFKSKKTLDILVPRWVLGRYLDDRSHVLMIYQSLKPSKTMWLDLKIMYPLTR